MVYKTAMFFAPSLSVAPQRTKLHSPSRASPSACQLVQFPGW